MAMETLRELCDKQKLDPKRVRSRLRKAVAEGKLKLKSKHVHRQNWEMTPQLKAFVLAMGRGKSLPALKTAKKAAPKKPAAKKAAKKAATPKPKTPETPTPAAA